MKQLPEVNRLLEAVTKLTTPHKSRIMQSNAAGISCISEVEHEPLLIQLRDAVAGGTSRHAGASLGSERIPLDPAALELFDRIVAQINAWYLQLPNVREERYIHDRLTDWYVDFENRRRAGTIPDSEERETIRLVAGWAHTVEGMFDPPVTLELTAQCPVCGERYAHNPKTGDQIAAIVIEYRNIGTETLDEATGLCRFCAAVWRGRTALRQLRFEIDAQEHADEPNDTTVVSA